MSGGVATSKLRSLRFCLRGDILIKEKQLTKTGGKGVAHPYLAMMGLYLGGFTGMYSETALNIALPQLSEAFGTTAAVTQWLVVGYMLVIGIVLPFASILMKWFNARTLTVFALAAFLIGSLASAFAPGFEVALAGRAIQGVGTGLVLPLMFAMVMEVMPPQKIGAAMGVTALVIMFASAIGPTMAGILVGALSWRSIFLSFAIILAVGLALTLAFAVNPWKLTRPHIDLASVVLSVLGFGGVVLGVGMSSLYGWASPIVAGALVVGVACIAGYSIRQLRMEAPILNLRAFQVRDFSVGAVLVMMNFGITLAAMYVLPQFYQASLGLSTAIVGLIMLPGGIVNALVSMLAGRVYDRIGARIPALAGFALSAIGSALLIMAGPNTTIPYVMTCHILLMIGVPLAMSPTQTYALSSLPPQMNGDGSTILNAMQQVFGAIATAVATSLLIAGQSAYFANGGASAQDAFATGSHYGFAFALIMAVLALMLAFRVKARKGETEQPDTAVAAGISPAHELG